jgi:hypothetical protein
VRVRADATGAQWWWFSPATARWSVAPSAKKAERRETLAFDFGDDGSMK